ncbi:S8 family serine peptidase [Paenibacillus sp. P36]|uniref:S8 family serine peptidase n=1 Tax=Paenibacillus sp. P36 TaxID=3342538 RepID=UPI0038B318D3
MAKLLIKQSVALLMASLMLVAPYSYQVAAAETSSHSTDLQQLQSKLHASLMDSLKSNSLQKSTNTDAPIIDPDIDTTSSKKVNVIVQLSGQPVTVAKYAAGLAKKSFSTQSAEQTLKAEQTSFLSAASTKGIGMKVNFEYNTVLNGLEVTMDANQIPQLAKVPGVKAISPNITYYAAPLPATPILSSEANVPINYDIDPLQQIGATEAWNLGYTGKGLKVGVIDTGVDYLHPDLASAYKGGYDSFYKDDDPYEDLPDDNYGFEGSDHGTHVSGTIVGRAVNQTSEWVQKGVAYEADLYSYKVLGKNIVPDDNGWPVVQVTGSSAQVIDGIEHAIKDGMDVINLSLGSNMEKSPDSPDSIAINNAVLSGVTAVVASGNSGSDGYYYYSMGSPASSQLGITVAAATSTSKHISGTVAPTFSNAQAPEARVSVNNAVYGAVTVNEAVYALDVMAWGVGQEDLTQVLGTDPLEAVYVGLGADSDYSSDVNYDGKVVFASRGVLSFDVKVKNAKNHHAKALIIFNGNAKNGQGTEVDLSEHIGGRDGKIGVAGFLGENYDFLPTFDMGGFEGRALARKIISAEYSSKVLNFTFGDSFKSEIVPGDRIADFSSRGPNSDGNYSIKPDIGGPGVNIRSTWPAFGKINPDANYERAYNRISGTSMASPHIAGLALLVLQKHPDWTPRDVRAALANTADTLVDEKGTQYDVYSQGAGRADVFSALATPALVEAMDSITIYDEKMNPKVLQSEASSVSFGAIEPGADALVKPLRLKNTSETELTYSASVVMHNHVTSDPSDPIETPSSDNVEVKLGGLMNPQSSTITVAGNTSHSFTLSAKAKNGAVHGVYEGEVLLQSTGLPNLHLPFVIHVGKDVSDNDFELQDMKVSNVKVSYDAPIEVSANLVSDEMNYMELYYTGVDDETSGMLSSWFDINLLDASLKPIPAGKFTFENVDGSYVGQEVDEYGRLVVKQLPEGPYKFVVVAVRYDKSLKPEKVTSISQTVYVQKSSAGTDQPQPPTTPTPPTSGGGGGGGGYIAPPAAGNQEVASSVVQSNQTIVPLTGSVAQQGDHSTVTVTDSELQKALDTAKQSLTAFSVSMSSSNGADKSASLSLTASQVNMLKATSKQSVIVFTWKDASVSLPLSALEGLKGSASLVIDITPAAEKTSYFAESYDGAAVIGTPYTFEVSSVVDGVKTPVTLKPDQVVYRSFIVEQAVDASRTGALYAEGTAVYPVPAQFKKTTDGKTIVTIGRPGLSTYVVASHSVAFTDIQSSWAKNQIETLTHKFILNGTSSTTFSPEINVTRAQFASMLVRALGLQMSAAAAPFSDVTSKDWFAQDVAVAYQAGLISGYDGIFNPNAEISRQDLTVMLSRAIKLLSITKQSVGTVKPYTDFAQFGDYAQESIQTVTDIGLMDGIEEAGSLFFRPTLSTTREAAAKVLHELLIAAKRIN